MVKFNPYFFKKISQEESNDALNKLQSKEIEDMTLQLIPEYNLKKEKLNDAWEREGGLAIYPSLKDFVEYKANCGSLFGNGDFFVWLFGDDNLSDSRPWNLPSQHKEAYQQFITILSDSSDKFCKLENFYNVFISYTWEYPDDIRLGIVGTASEEWEYSSLHTPVAELKDAFISGMKECADLLEQDGGFQGTKTANAIREILNKLSDLHSSPIDKSRKDATSPCLNSTNYSFVGKTLDELDLRGCSDLVAYLIAHKHSPMIKGRHGVDGKEDIYGVFEALQEAENLGQAINQHAVIDILESDMTSREKLDAAINEIKGYKSE